MNITSKFPGRCKRCNETFPAGTVVEYARGIGAYHLTPKDCSDARVARLEREKDLPALNLQPIISFLEGAKLRGLKNPKLRALAPDGRRELQISITRGGVAPGSIAIVLGGEYVGAIRPTGVVAGKLASSPELQQHLLTIAADPISAAKSYAALTGNCMFCGKLLEDDGSTEVGYGPVCAKRYGLPHVPQGVRVLSTRIV